MLLYFQKNTSKILFALLIILFHLFNADIVLSQSIANYPFSTNTTSSLEDLTTGATSLLTGNNDDVATSVTTIGFDFFFGGVRYTYFSANSNGQVKLHTSSGATAISSSNVTTYSASTPILFPMSADNEVNGGMRYKIIGATPGSRKFVLEWTQFYAYYTDLTNAGHMQLWLDESNGKITYVYGEVYNSNSAISARGIAISFSNTATTARYVTVAASPTSTASATLTTNNFAAGSGTSTGSPLIANLGTNNASARRAYFFTPNATTAPTTLTFTSITISSMTLNWVDNASDELGYAIYYSTDGTNYTYYTTTAASATSQSVTGLSAATTYYWKVYAVRESLSSALTGTQATLSCAAPTTQATGVVPFTNVCSTSATISWSNGNGDNRVVFMKEASSGTAAPTDGTTYTANTIFQSGTQILTSGWYCIYNGTGSSVNVTNLTLSTNYIVHICESNCSGTNIKYNITSSTNNPYSQATSSGVTLSYSQGFNATTIPACWTQQYVSGTSNIQYVASSTNPATTPQEGADYVYWNSFNYSSGSETRLITPPIITTGTSSVDVKFYWKNNNNSSYNSGAYLNEGVFVQYSTDGSTWDAGAFYARHDGTLTVGTNQWNLKVLTLPAGAGNQAQIYVSFKFHSSAGDNCSLDNVVIEPTPTITLADNGTQVSPANVNSGTTSHVLHKFSLAVSGSNVTLTGMTCTTAGSYASSDITNLKVWYSADNTFGSDVLLSTLTTPGVAGAKTFPSFTSQIISGGTTGYIFITADIASNAINNNTINLNAITTGNLTFSNGVKTGSTSIGGTQTIIDVSAPTVTTYNPTDGNTSVTINQNLILTFSENVQSGTSGNVVIYNSDNSIFETIPYNDSRITFSTNTITINPTGTFAIGAGYYVQISGTAIRDAVGIFYAGISDATTWNFTTVAPTVLNVTSSTANGNYKIGDVITITVTFDAIVNVTGTPSIQLETGTTDEQVNYSSGSGSAVLTFLYTVIAGDISADLDYKATGSLTLNGGTINSAGGIAAVLTLPTVGGASSIAGQKAIVIDGVLPTVSTYNPTDGSTSVTANQNLILTFSENVQIGSAGNIVIYNSDNSIFETIPYNDSRITISTNTVTINPAGTFLYSSSYYVQISNAAIKDVASNAYVGISDATTWNFTTVCAPLSGTINVGAAQTYTTLTGAGGLFASINNCGLSGNLTVNITSNITETGINALNQWTGAYTLTIQPDATTLRTISGTVATNSAMISINGADGLTIDGGAGRYLLFRNTNATASSTRSTIQFTNGSTSCTLTRCNIENNSTSSSYADIYIGSGTNSVTISNNDIHNATGGTTGNPYNAIYSSNSGNTLILTNNNIYNWSNYGIYGSSMADAATITGNSFYSTVVATTTQYAIYIAAGNSHNISNNFIGGQSASCGGSAWSNSGASSYFYGIYLSVGTSTAASIQGNTIQNITLVGTSSYFYGININSGLVNIGTTSGNVIGHTSTANSVSIAYYGYGIYMNSSTTSSNIERSIIANITYTGTASPNLEGIYINGGNIRKNKIYNIGASSASATPTIYGIFNNGVSGATNDFSNNFIALSGGSATNPLIYGFYDNSYASSTYNFYFNSINIFGSATTTSSTFAYYRAVGAINNFKNNIVSNKRTAGGTGKHYAMYVSSTTGTWTCDYNDLYSSTASTLGYWSADKTFTTWKTAEGNQDANSANANPAFTSSTDLHLATSVGTAITGTGVSTDIDDEIRSSATPWMGADEFIPPCAGTPTGGTANATPASVCTGGLTTLSITGATNATGLTYQWQSSSDNATWSNIATGLTYNATLSSNTYYRRVITCTASGLSANSASILVSIVSCYTMDNTPVTTCSGYFYDSGGPSSDYAGNEWLTKTFTSTSPTNALQFTFTSFDSESCCDSLYVFDGPNSSSSQVSGSPFSGTTLPPLITSSSNSLTFRFSSDGGTVGAGWVATIACATITVPPCPTLVSPADASTGICPGTGVDLTWTAGSGTFGATGYKLYFGTNNPPTNILNGSDLGNITSYNTGPLISNTAYYWKVVPYNVAGDNTACTTVRLFTTTNVSVTSTNSPITTCLNTYALTATGSGTLNWYSVATGGSALATGSPYNATFSGNTTYYVGATTGSTSDYAVGHTGPNNDYFASSSMGIRFTTIIPLTIKTVNIYVETSNTTVTVRIQNTSGTEILTPTTFSGLSVGLHTLTLNYSIPTPGNYIMISTGGVSLGQSISGYSFPYTVSGVISLTSSEWWGVESGEYDYFYNWVVSAGSSCESARTPVSITHTASPITITPNGSTTFLLGGSVGLTAYSSASYTYSWSPSTGLNTTSGAAVVATPTNTTSYTVTGTTGGCTNTQTVTINVTQPCTGLGTGVTNISSLPYTDNGQTTCGDIDDITSATAIIGGSSSYYTGEDFVYNFTPTSSGNVSINLTSAGTWTGLMLYQGCPMNGQGGACIAYNQSSTGSKSMCVSVTSGVSYYLILDSDASPTCNPYDITISAPDPSGTPNDLPCNATTLAIWGIELGDNTCASSGGEPSVPSCWTNGAVNTLWYKIVAPASGSLKIKSILGSLTNTQIAVYQGNCSSLSLVSNACNDDYTACSTTLLESQLSLTGLVAGNTYYIVVDGYESLVGSFSITAIDGANNWPGVPQQDCGSTTTVCNSQTVVGNPGFIGAGSTCDFSSGYGCLSSGELNSAWYLASTNGTAGNFIFSITPTASTDYDWGVWDVTGIPNPCTAINANSTANLIRCSYSAISGATGLNATAGDNSEGAGGDGWCSQIAVDATVHTYLINIQNFSSNNMGFTLDLQTTPGNYNIPATLTWSGAVSSAWNNAANWGSCTVPLSTTNVVVVNGPAYQPIINATGAVCKSIQIINGASLTINAGLTLQVFGDFENLGLLFLNNTSTILMDNGSVIQNLNGMITGVNKFGNFTINKTGGNVNMNQDFEIGGNFTTLSVNSNLTATTQTLKLGGNVTIASNTSLSCPNIEFNGIGAQTFTNSSGTAIFTNITMNNSGSGLTLTNTAASSMYINGILTLTEGRITPASNAVFVMNSGSSISGGSILSYVNGAMQKIGNTSFTFPIGKSSRYARLGIAASTTATNIFKAEYFKTTPPNNSSSFMNTGLDHVSYVEYWTIDKIAGSEYPATTLYWEDASTVVELAAPYDSIIDLRVAHWNGTKWTDMSGGVSNASGTWPSGTISSTQPFSSYSPITFGSKTGKNPLPVDLLYFKGKNEGNINILDWSTTSETNNNYFSLEWSIDALNFEEIGTIKGSGNSNSIKNYQFIDSKPNEGINYYKLKQTDFDGNSKHPSNIIALDFLHFFEYYIYPNPAKDELLISCSTKGVSIIKYIITDISGRKILQQDNVLLKENNQMTSIDISNISEGVYFIAITDLINKTITQKKFVKIK